MRHAATAEQEQEDAMIRKRLKTALMTNDTDVTHTC
jgi:hypothetical protein